MNTSNEVKQNSIETINPTLGILSSNIIKSMTDTESNFLELGQSLQTIYSESENLIKIITHAAERFNVKSEENIIQVIEKSISDVLAELSGYSVKIASNMDHISESGQYLENMCNLCIHLKSESRFLNVVGLNFDIEGCRSREAMDMFEGFAEEIKELSVKINEMAEKMIVDSTMALAGQRSGISGISDRIEEIKVLTNGARDAVMKTMGNIQSLADISCHTLEQAQHTAQAIQKMIGEIVMAIQFHDIARQQLEHITEAFEDVMELLNEQPYLINAKATNTIKISGRIVDILKVQYDQLLNVINEIHQAYEKIMFSFQEISRKVGSLKHLLNESGTSKNQATSLETEFKSITGRMKELKQLQDQGRNLGGEMIKTIQESSDVITVLSQSAGQIDSINIGLKHKALNAIIMTTKLGEKGFTLEVLAREISNISLDCTGLVEKALKNLTSISEIARLLTADKEDTFIQSFEKISLDTRTKEISKALDLQKNDSDHVSKIAQVLEEKIEKTGKELLFLNVWVEQLRHSGVILDELVSSLEPLIDTEDQSDTGHIETLSKRYTMESERIIHNRISEDENLKSIPLDSCVKKQDTSNESLDIEADKENETFDDNIELF